MASDTNVRCKHCGQTLWPVPGCGPAKHYWCDDCKFFTVPSDGDLFDSHWDPNNEMVNPEQEK